jgi:hypothetical protein
MAHRVHLSTWTDARVRRLRGQPTTDVTRARLPRRRCPTLLASRSAPPPYLALASRRGPVGENSAETRVSSLAVFSE